MIVDVSTLPKRMQGLPRDERGYPVPWFVDWIDGKPEFRAMDMSKFADAIRKKLCWVCGEPMGVHIAFVAGPMCGINKTSSEPPSHRECAEWSAVNCPFLANPRMVRREDERINNSTFSASAAGYALARNPGVAMVWITREYEIYRSPAGGSGYLLEMGEPEEVLWYREGRRATRAEVQEAIDAGIHSLENLARLEEGGLAALQRAVNRFERHLPKE